MIDPRSRPVKIVGMPRGNDQDRAPRPRGATASLSSGQSDTAVLLPRVRIRPRSRRLLRTQTLGPLIGPLALALLAAATLTVVLVASATPNVLVQGSFGLYPSWMAGPLHGLLGPLLLKPSGSPALRWQTVAQVLTAAIVVMMIAYGVALTQVRALSMRSIVVMAAALYVVVLLCPPLGLSDVFNYLGYARLGALHGLNPYTHVVHNEHFDPVYAFVTWRNYHSPYGQVFTMLTYPLGLMSLPVSYWVLKVGMVLLMGAFVALVWKCARQLGHDPRFAVLFVALNPIVLIYDIGGFHNDPVMLVPMMAAISLLLARRYRWAGAALAVAIGVKPTIVLLLPFMMLAARPARRSLQVLLGTVLGAIPLAIASFALFGFSMPNVADQSIIVTPFSVVNLFGVAFHLGGAGPGMEQASKVVLVVCVGLLLVSALRRGRPDWLTGAGWATLALLVCTAWLMPWYVVWALPLVALSTSRRLRVAMALFMTFAVITFLPYTAMLYGRLHINLMRSPADEAAIWRLYTFQH